jgi:hypothetical protein
MPALVKFYGLSPIEIRDLRYDELQVLIQFREAVHKEEQKRARQQRTGPRRR